LKRARSPLIREAVATLGEHGRVADVDLNGTHYKVSWLAQGRRHTLVVAKTPSDVNAGKQSARALKRLLNNKR
jgi:hypothetical protein